MLHFTILIASLPMTIFDSRPSNHFNNILYNIRLDAMFAKRILIEPETTKLAQRFYKKIKKNKTHNSTRREKIYPSTNLNWMIASEKRKHSFNSVN